jgi:DNA-binding FadR family transcriptional regulator
VFKAVKKTDVPLTDLVANRMTQLIVEGTLQPGDQMPSELELSRSLGVSRSTVREGVKQLVCRNVLEIRRGNGTFVCETVGVMKDPLGLKFLPDTLRKGRELCEICSLLEPQMVLMAAENATAEEKKRLQALNREMKLWEHEGAPGVIQGRHIIALLARCSRNQVMERLVPVLHDSMPPMTEADVPALSAVVDAVCAGDAQSAYNAMEQLLEIRIQDVEIYPKKAKKKVVAEENAV